MKKVIIVAPQFPPCNLTAAHRSRYFATHLSKFGWLPKIVTVAPCCYRGALDWELEKILPANLEIIRSGALPNKFLGLIGDIGLRSVWRHYKELSKIIKKEKIDLVYIPVPPNYSAILGPIFYKKFGIPYGIDYIDPWIDDKIYYKPFSKGWWADRLGRILEPATLKYVSFITAVAPGYYQQALARYSWLDKEICFSMPYGAEKKEFEFLAENPRPVYLFDPKDNNFHVVYAGAMLPKAYPVLEVLSEALLSLKKEEPILSKRLKFHFIGTGSNPCDSRSYNIKPVAEKYNLLDMIIEYPARVPYLDALNHLRRASAVLILGSTQAHYTPSKVFQAILSQRPVIAILNQKSSAGEVLRKAKGARLVAFSGQNLLKKRKSEIKNIFIQMLNLKNLKGSTDLEEIKAYSAEAMAGKLAGVFDRALSKNKNGRQRKI